MLRQRDCATHDRSCGAAEGHEQRDHGHDERRARPLRLEHVHLDLLSAPVVAPRSSCQDLRRALKKRSTRSGGGAPSLSAKRPPARDGQRAGGRSASPSSSATSHIGRTTVQEPAFRCTQFEQVFRPTRAVRGRGTSLAPSSPPARRLVNPPPTVLPPASHAAGRPVGPRRQVGRRRRPGRRPAFRTRACLIPSAAATAAPPSWAAVRPPTFFALSATSARLRAARLP